MGEVEHPGAGKSREELTIPRPEGDVGRSSYQNTGKKQQ